MAYVESEQAKLNRRARQRAYRDKFYTGVHKQVGRVNTARDTIGTRERASDSYLGRDVYNALNRYTTCNNCGQESNDLMYVHRLEWLICGACRQNYNSALKGLDARANGERALAFAADEGREVMEG